MRNKQSTLLYKYFNEVWNKGNENAIDEFLHIDSKHHGIIPEDQSNGITGVKLFFNDFRRKFNNININVEDVISQDDLECARTIVTAIHTETKKPVVFSGMCMVKITDGKITAVWNNFDFLNLYQQLEQKIKPLE